MSKAPLLIVAAGGTAGHMYPAQSLTEVMLAEGWRVKLATDARGARYTDGFAPEVERQVLPAATFTGRNLLAKIAAPIRIVAGILGAVFGMMADRPTVVVGFGGYPALPTMAAAWILRRPRMIHEQNGVLGRVNAAFARRVNTVACSAWPTELPSGAPAVHTGNPVRRAIREVAATPYPRMDGPLRILMIGGSQGASLLSRTVGKAFAHLSEDLRDRISISHQAREADHEEAVAAYADLGVEAVVKPFFDDVPTRMSQAHLVIARSGASSVADIAAIGRPSILIPLAIAVRDEQTANARGLVEAGGAIAMQEKDFTPESLASQITDILSSPDRAKAMADAALTLGRPDAVDRLKDEVLKLAGTL